MARPRKKTDKVYSSISDERLAVIIAKDYDRAPAEFAATPSCNLIDSREFLHNTSAKGIEPMKKWL